MIIDIILDRRDEEKRGIPYNPARFYREIFGYIGGCGSEYAKRITLAMDYGAEEEVKMALIQYVEENGYNPQIEDYILSRDWL